MRTREGKEARLRIINYKEKGYNQQLNTKMQKICQELHAMLLLGLA